MTATTGPATAPAAVLTPGRLSRLAEVFSAAITHKDPGGCTAGDCTACDDETGVVCGEHQADAEKADEWTGFALELGIRPEELDV